MNKLNRSRDGAAGARWSNFRLRSSVLPLTFAALLIAIYGNVVPAAGQAQPVPPPAPTPEASPSQKPKEKKAATPAVMGTIRGRVLSDDGRPLTNANVVAQSITNKGLPRASPVDSEGNFVFDDMAAAVYVILATAPGYIDPSFSTGDPNQWPRHLIGSQLRLTLVKGGIITGTVTNSRGEPVVGVPVRANLANGPPASFVNFVSGGGVSESDDRGIYRIYGLLPGQYTVSAGGGGQFGNFSANGFDLDVPIYYPSSTRDTAVPVSVRGGDATTGIDIKYRGIEGHSISGVVLGTIDASATTGAVTVILSHAGTTSMLSIALASVAEERRAFSFNGVADGDYDVLGSFLADQNSNALVGTNRVSVRGADVTGLELRLAQLSSITGSITLDPIKPEDKCDKRQSQLIETSLGAPRDDRKKSGSQAMTALYAGLGGTVNDKGEFALRNLDAGRYRLEVKLPTESWYVRAINLTGPPPAPQSSSAGPLPTPGPSPANTWPGVVTLKIGERINGASIAVGQDAAGLRGQVTTSAEGSRLPVGLRVHLVPVDRDQANNILRYSETTVDSDGSFRLANVAPGRYFLVSRVETPAEPDGDRRPIAWDPTARAKLRREAEATKMEIELKPCQAITDYSLKPNPAP